MTKYKFFWSGPFSNWYMSNFTIDGITYNCVEQYMMYQKGIMFNDIKTAQKILNEHLPEKQKGLGRLVKNFDPSVWDEKKYEMVKHGIRAKFNQNESLKRKLLKFKGYQFVEASPKDRIWGIGFHESNALNNINNWGENLLGKILTEISEEL